MRDKNTNRISFHGVNLSAFGRTGEIIFSPEPQSTEATEGFAYLWIVDQNIQELGAAGILVML